MRQNGSGKPKSNQFDSARYNSITNLNKGQTPGVNLNNTNIIIGTKESRF